MCPTQRGPVNTAHDDELVAVDIDAPFGAPRATWHAPAEKTCPPCTGLMYLARIPRAFPTAQRRSFVSTVLLSRTWENETVVELRKEAKVRGLSTKGNKSTLIARIQEHEKNSAASTPPIHTPGMVRSAATSVVPQVSPKKTSQATSPGIPLVVQSDRASTNSDFLAIKLPDLSRPPPNIPVQIPYVPDFWNSARPKADAPLELEPPKLHVVSGSITHYDGGPTHNLQDDGSPSTTIHADGPPVKKEIRLWTDFWESLGLPRSFSIRRTLSEAGNLAAQAGGDGSRTHLRPLTDEERKGVYILLGIIGGSWLVGGLVNRPAAVAEHEAQN